MKAADSQTAVRAAEGARDWSGNERPTERRRGAKRAALPGAEGAGGRELQRKARRPACGARARKKIRKEKTAGKLRRRLKMNGFICFVRPAFSGRQLSGRRKCFAERGRIWQTPS